MVKFTWVGLGSVWALDLNSACAKAVDEFCTLDEKGGEIYYYIWETKPQLSLV